MTSKEQDLKDLIKIEISGSEPCVKSVKFTVPSETVDREINSMVKEFAKYTQVPGFRTGKTPVSIIRNRFLPRIEAETMKNFYTSALEKISSGEKDKLDVASYTFPQTEPQKLEAGKEYSFTIIFNIVPEIKIPEYKGIKLNTIEIKVPDNRLDDEIRNLREMYGDFSKIDGPAAKGDMVKISYKSDFEAPKESAVKLKQLLETAETWAWLSDPEIIPGMNKALQGVSVGNDCTLDADFPADFREKEIAGRKIKYSIKILEIQRRVPVSSDEDLLKKLNAKDMPELRERLKTSIEFQEKQKADGETRKQALDKIMAEAGEFPLPPAVLAEAEQKEFRLIASREVKKESDVEKFKTEKDRFLAEAKKSATERIRRYFVLRKIAQAEKITVEQSEFDSHIQGISRYYGVTEKDFRSQIEASGGIEDLHIDMLMAKVTEFIVKNADSSK